MRTPTDPWFELLAAAEYDEPVIGGDRIAQWPAETLGEMLTIELLQEHAMLHAVDCPECPEAGWRDIAWMEHPMTGEARPYRLCPSCGAEEVPVESLRTWTVSWPVLVNLTRTALQARGTLREIVPQRLWRLGKVQGREAYFGRAMHRRDADAALNRIVDCEDGWLLVPKRLPAMSMSIAVTALNVTSDWEQGKVSINGLALPTATPEAPRKRRRRKRADRAGLIDRLTREMEQHVRAARDHAQAALDYRGEAAVLPRPTQRELATRCDASEVAVSRCLRDPTARELRLLWDLAVDVDRLIRVS